MALRRVQAQAVPASIATVVLAVTLHFPLMGFEMQGEGKSLTQEMDRTQFIEGPAVFQAYCAACHGKDARGGGPAAGALKRRPPDLTRMSQRNRGIFPFESVQKIISGKGTGIPAHGSREMPIWGPIFDEISWDGAPGSYRIYNLTRYIQDLQQK